MARKCLACDKSLGAFSSKIAVADGHVCFNCWDKAGMETTFDAISSGKLYNSTTIKEIITARVHKQALIDNFKPTGKVSILSFDDNTQSFIISKSKNLQELYYYNQIVSFELLEDGETVTKGGLGRAMAGGLLFGGVGAIVGGVTGGKKSKVICTSLQIKITLRESPKQTEYIHFINTKTKTNSIAYKTAYISAQEVLSALQLATDKVDNTPTPVIQQVISGADEILKYKELLDAGILTEEEFNAKKVQILGL